MSVYTRNFIAYMMDIIIFFLLILLIIYYYGGTSAYQYIGFIAVLFALTIFSMLGECDSLRAVSAATPPPGKPPDPASAKESADAPADEK